MFIATVKFARRISSHIVRFYSPVSTASSTHSGVPGAPRPLITVKRFPGEVRPNSFIVTLKPGMDTAAHLAALQPHLADSQITEDYCDFFNVYCGTFSESALNVLRASPDVELIEEDGIFHIMATPTQTNTP